MAVLRCAAAEHCPVLVCCALLMTLPLFRCCAALYEWPSAGVLGLVSWPTTIENRVDTWVETGVEVSGERALQGPTSSLRLEDGRLRALQ